MRQGKFNKIISIQTPSRNRTESGKVETTWVDFYTGVYAEIKTPTGREFYGQEKLNAQISHIVHIRWHDNLKPEMRIVWGTRILNIKYISEDDTHAREQWIYCMEDKD